MPRAARVVALSLLVLPIGACAGPRLDRDGARDFAAGALRASGVGGVVVARATSPCKVKGDDGWRAVADTDIGEVSLCVSRDQGRALSVRDPGMSDAQFARLEAYRGETAADRARPLAAASAGLLLVGVLAKLALLLGERRRHP